MEGAIMWVSIGAENVGIVGTGSIEELITLTFKGSEIVEGTAEETDKFQLRAGLTFPGEEAEQTQAERTLLKLKGQTIVSTALLV
jgi:hypothetical protein